MASRKSELEFRNKKSPSRGTENSSRNGPRCPSHFGQVGRPFAQHANDGAHAPRPAASDLLGNAGDLRAHRQSSRPVQTKNELEDLWFRYLHPEVYTHLQEQLGVEAVDDVHTSKKPAKS